MSNNYNKCAYLNNKCPDYCYGDSCTSTNTCRNNICKCNNIRRLKEKQRYDTQAKLTLLSKYDKDCSDNNAVVEENFNNCTNLQGNTYYNSIYTQVYNSFFNRMVVNGDNNSRQYKMAQYIANRKAQDWIKRYANSQGTTNNGWPATQLVGTNKFIDQLKFHGVYNL